MKKLFVICLAVLFVTLPPQPDGVRAYGYNLTYPLIRRTRVSQDYWSKHKAHDYKSAHTKVVAPLDGEVTRSFWGYDDGEKHDCDETLASRGNFIVLDHDTPDDLTTLYFHLSNTGKRTGVGQRFSRGQYVALTDNNGCSGTDHLHFAVKVEGEYGTPVDPDAGSSHWVGGEPIPLGYVNQDGHQRGPYQLSCPSIRNKWLALDGKPGSPLGNYQHVGGGEYRQDFEHGYIYTSGYCPALAQGYSLPLSPEMTTYHEYDKTFLPDIRANRLYGHGWDSTIIVRNDGNDSADVTITFYNRAKDPKQDRIIKTSRTYKSLPKNATWTLDVHQVIYDDPLINDWSYDFNGSASVSASRDVSVVVTQRHTSPEAWAAYAGVRQPTTAVHVPILHRNNYGWDSQLFIQNAGSAATIPTVRFEPSPGYPGSTCNYPLPEALPAGGMAMIDMNGISCVGSTFVGSAYTTASQPLAVARSQFNGDAQLMESSRDGGTAGGTAPVVYAPLIQNDNYRWNSGVASQNASSAIDWVYTWYDRAENGVDCQHEDEYLLGRYVQMYPSPPGGQGNQGPCSKILSGKIFIWGNGKRVAGNVNQLRTNSNYATDYPAVASPGDNVSIPLLMKDYNGWNSGFVVQNQLDTYTMVTVVYYDQSGSMVCFVSQDLWYEGHAWVVYPLHDCVGSDFYGSAVINASDGHAVAVSVNHLKSGGDSIMSHIGVHR